MKSEIPIEIVEIEEGGCHLFLKCKLEDDVEADLILDTGASKTVFNETLISPYLQEISENENLESSGISEEKLSSSTGKLSRLVFGDMILHNEIIVVMNLDHINELYKKIEERKIWGLLGGDYLLKYDALIDYKNKVLIFNY